MITVGSLVAAPLTTVALSGLPEEPSLAWGRVGTEDAIRFASGALRWALGCEGGAGVTGRSSLPT